MFRRRQWLSIGGSFYRTGQLPNDIACITLDGRTFDRDTLEAKLRTSAQCWNEWRSSLPPLKWWRERGDPIGRWTPGFFCSLPDADLRRVNLDGYDFSGCSLPRAKFTQASLKHTNFSDHGPHGSLEGRCDLRGAIFRSTEIRGGTLNRALLDGVDFSHAQLNGVHLHGTKLSNCKFYKTLVAGDFEDVDFSDSDFNESYVFHSSFVNCDLSAARNLSLATYYPDSTIDHRTLAKSYNLPLEFYRGCGLPESFIEYIPSLFSQPIMMESCFLSHSSRDEVFVKKLYSFIQDNAIKCFYAPRDLRIGTIIRDEIDRAIHLNDKVLVVLSKNSITSQWIEHEVEAAFERERVSGRLILFPITIDDAVFEAGKAWAANLHRQRNIGDFRGWKNEDRFRASCRRLLDDWNGQPDGNAT